MDVCVLIRVLLVLSAVGHDMCNSVTAICNELSLQDACTGRVWRQGYQLNACIAHTADVTLGAMQTVLTSPELKAITENTGVLSHRLPCVLHSNRLACTAQQASESA